MVSWMNQVPAAYGLVNLPFPKFHSRTEAKLHAQGARMKGLASGDLSSVSGVSKVIKFDNPCPGIE